MLINERLRRFFTPGLGLLSWLLATMMVGFVTTNVIESNWVRGFEPMRSAAFGACVVGVLLARWRDLPAFIAHVLALLLGLGWSISQLRIDPRLATFGDQATEVLIRIIVLVRTLKSGGSPEDYYLFSLGGILAAWVLGYATVWLLFRLGWVWRAVLLNCGLIMLNLTYALPKSKPSFWLCIAVGLILIVFETFRERQQRWDEGALEQQEWLSLRYLWAGLIACVLLVMLAATLPASISNAQLRLLGDRLIRPLDAIQEAFDLPGVGEGIAPPATPANKATFANNTVALGGARVATNKVVL